MGVLAVLGLLVYFTLFLPAEQRHGNDVRLGDLTVRLAAGPHTGPAPLHAARLIDLDLRTSGAIDDVDRVDFSTSMPAMANMSGRVADVQQIEPGHYRAIVGLDMGGLWQIQARIHHLGGPAQVATFDVRL